MYWAIGLYAEYEWSPPGAPEPKREWRIISGPHRSKYIAGELAEWEQRRQNLKATECAWRLISWKVISSDSLAGYGLVSAGWKIQPELDLNGGA